MSEHICIVCGEPRGEFSRDGKCRDCRSKKFRKGAGLPPKKPKKKKPSRICVVEGCRELISVRSRIGYCRACVRRRASRKSREKHYQSMGFKTCKDCGYKLDNGICYECGAGRLEKKG